MPKSFSGDYQKLLLDLQLQLCITKVEIPKCPTILWKNNWEIYADLRYFFPMKLGINSINLVKRSTYTKIVLKPFESWKLITKSLLQKVKCEAGMGGGWSKPECKVVKSWTHFQITHIAMNLLISTQFRPWHIRKKIVGKVIGTKISIRSSNAIIPW